MFSSCLRVEAFRAGVTLLRQDLRREWPEGPFHLVLCRNVAFTYFAPALQQQVLAELCARLVPGGLLVLGKGEALPEDAAQRGFVVEAEGLPLYRREA